MNNIISFYTHEDKQAKHSQPIFYRRGTISYWLVTITETLVTLSISACTIFCMYLAYTML